MGNDLLPVGHRGFPSSITPGLTRDGPRPGDLPRPQRGLGLGDRPPAPLVRSWQGTGISMLRWALQMDELGEVRRPCASCTAADGGLPSLSPLAGPRRSRSTPLHWQHSAAEAQGGGRVLSICCLASCLFLFFADSAPRVSAALALY